MSAPLALLAQLIWICLHTAALAYLRFPAWEFMAPLILAMTFIPADRVRLIGISNLLFVTLSGSLLMVALQSVNAVNHPWPPSWVLGVEPTSWGHRSAVFACFILLYFALFKAFSNFKFLRHPVTAGLATVALVTGLVHILEPDTAVRGVAIGVLFALTKVFWPMLYQLSETDFLKRIPFFYHLGTLSAPWQGGWVSNSIVRGYSDYCNFAVRDKEKFRKTQFSGLRLVICAIVFQFLANLISGYFFANPLTPSPFSILIGMEFSQAGYLQQTLTRPYAWLFVIINLIYFIFSLTAFTHGAVSIARMCGFEILRNVYRPLEATSFNNFLGRIYYYYIAILQRFFFYPFWRMLRFIGNRRLRTGATILLTIFIGGMVTSLLHHLPFKLDNFLNLWSVLESRMSYFILLGLLCSLSALTPPWPPWCEQRVTRGLRGLWFFLLYGLCYSTQMKIPELGAFAGLWNLAYLFGF